jgi:hypothetical protein
VSTLIFLSFHIPPCKDTATSHHHGSRGWALHRHQVFQSLDVGLCSPTLWEINFCCSKMTQSKVLLYSKPKCAKTISHVHFLSLPHSVSEESWVRSELNRKLREAFLSRPSFPYIVSMLATEALWRGRISWLAWTLFLQDPWWGPQIEHQPVFICVYLWTGYFRLLPQFLYLENNLESTFCFFDLHNCFWMYGLLGLNAFT